MRFLKISLITLFVLAFVPRASLAQDECSGIAFLGGYARPSVTQVAGVFGTLVNVGAQDDTLLSVTADAADAVEIHETIMGDNDVMTMQPLTEPLLIPARGAVTLKRGGLHIMLIGLQDMLIQGDSLDLTFKFEQAGDLSLSLPIYDPELDMDGTMLEDAAPTITLAGSCAGVQALGFRATPSDGNSAPLSGYVLNFTENDDSLIAASSEAAETVAPYQTGSDELDQLSMIPVENFALPAGTYLELNPEGAHLMLMNLSQPLAEGDSFDLTLTLEKAGELVVPVTVTPPAAEAEGGMDMSHMGH